ncbi:MAG: hypothetical protein ACFFCS_13150 [Candidatus Hodarchaeota archaeon]
MERKEISRGIRLMKRTGSTLYVIIGLLLIAVAVVALILLDPEEIMDNWELFLAGGILLFGGGGIFVISGALNYRIRKPKRAKVAGFLLSGAVVLGTLVSGVSWLAWDLFVPKPYELYPREYAIDFDPSYVFSTQYGDYNTTLETLYASQFSSNITIDPPGYAWGESYIARGFVHNYNATKDFNILLTFLNHTDTIYNNRDRNNDGIPGYGTDAYPLDNPEYWEYTVWDAVITMPLLQLSNIIKNNATLWNDTTLYDGATLQERAINYTTMSEQIIQKWNATHWVDQGDRGYWVIPPKNVTWSSNRFNAMGLMLLQLYDYTDNQTYLDHVYKVARFFKGILTTRSYTMDGVSKEMYTWGDGANSDTTDTSHGCLCVEFAVDCHERGIVFTSTDMRRFSHTFFDFVYKGRSYQTARVESDGVNHTNIYADAVNGRLADEGSNHYLSLRQAWFQLYRYYENTTISSYVVFRSLEDLIRSLPYRPPYTSLGVTYMQCLSAIREMAFVFNEFPVDWLS